MIMMISELSQASYFLLFGNSRLFKGCKDPLAAWLLYHTRYGFTEIPAHFPCEIDHFEISAAYHSAFAGGIPVVWSFLMVNKYAGVVAVQALSHFFNICQGSLHVHVQQQIKAIICLMFMIQKSIYHPHIAYHGIVWLMGSSMGIDSKAAVFFFPHFAFRIHVSYRVVSGELSPDRSPEVGCLKASTHWWRSWINSSRPGRMMSCWLGKLAARRTPCRGLWQWHGYAMVTAMVIYHDWGWYMVTSHKDWWYLFGMVKMKLGLPAWHCQVLDDWCQEVAVWQLFHPDSE